jgi:cytochrome c-type biogenesis protein CcmE
MSIKTKLLLTVALLAACVGYMIVTTVRSGEALSYFKHVEEVMAAPEKWRGQSLQLHGNVVQGSILKKPAALDYKFALHHDQKWIEVSYTGLVPDSFGDCAELVIKGQLHEGRHFVAEELSAKCPSKYDGKRRTGCGEELRAEVFSHRSK